MGAGGSKEAQRTGRSSRSAAQRLLDQRRSTGQGQKFRPPSRSKSVGDGIQKQSAFQVTFHPIKSQVFSKNCDRFS
jgi:hypothetical protein